MLKAGEWSYRQPTGRHRPWETLHSPCRHKMDVAYVVQLVRTPAEWRRSMVQVHSYAIGDVTSHGVAPFKLHSGKLLRAVTRLVGDPQSAEAGASNIPFALCEASICGGHIQGGSLTNNRAETQPESEK